MQNTSSQYQSLKNKNRAREIEEDLLEDFHRAKGEIKTLKSVIEILKPATQQQRN